MNGRRKGWRQSADRCCIGIMVGILGVAGKAASGSVVDLEDLALAPGSFYNGSDGAGGFTSRGAFFNNTFTDFGGGFTAWSGWSYSNMTDNTTPGFANQYSAIPGSGAGGSANYAVAFASAPGDATVELPASAFPESIRVTNTTYAYLSMLHGDPFAKKFGGTTGDDPDYFLLTITGLDATGSGVGAVETYLADYRFADNAMDYLVDTWADVDLSSLVGAMTLSFSLESTDMGMFGMNTPAYFAIDNLRLVPEPATVGLIAVGALSLLHPQSRRWRRVK